MVNLILMSEYQLQTEISDETKRELVLHSEELNLLAEIQTQKKKISERFYTYTKVSSLLVLLNVILNFLIERPGDFFVVIVYGIAYVVEIVWLMFGLRKQRQKLEEWKRTFAETEIQKLVNQ